MQWHIEHFVDVQGEVLWALRMKETHYNYFLSMLILVNVIIFILICYCNYCN
jgi:hypothetical protein